MVPLLLLRHPILELEIPLVIGSVEDTEAKVGNFGSDWFKKFCSMEVLDLESVLEELDSNM